VKAERPLWLTGPTVLPGLPPHPAFTPPATSRRSREQRVVAEAPAARVLEHVTWPDIQAALSVIGHQSARYDGRLIDLTGANLAGADLTGALLARVDFTDTDVARTALYSADLSGARFVRADLTGARLGGADLTGALWAEESPLPAGWVRDAGLGRFRRANACSGNFGN
jgi:hypothetical protein